MMPPLNLTELRYETFSFGGHEAEETLRYTALREEINHRSFPNVLIDYTRR